jgi:hypothetical protein
MYSFKNQLARISMSIAALSCAFFTQSAFAISTIPARGVCGFAISGSFPFIGVQLTGKPVVSTSPWVTGNSPSASGSLNWLGTLDFDTNTITVNVVTQRATDNGTSPTFVNSQNQTSLGFTVSGPTNGVYVLDLGANGSINVIPVNGGATLLMQQYVSNDAGGKAGVCQF